MRWLHISDIHFNMKGYEAENVRNQLLAKLKELNLTMDFILITGDCMFKFGKGTWGQSETIAYIKAIAKACKCSRKRVYMCPGNHDVDRDNGERNKLIDDIRGNNKDFSDNFKELCQYGYDRYQLIHKDITSTQYEPYKVLIQEKNRIESYQ